MNWIERSGMNSPLHTMELRILAGRLLRIGGDTRGGQVLEIGCGHGMSTQIIFDLFEASSVEAFDVDPVQVKLARRRFSGLPPDKAKVSQGSATEIHAEAGCFDAVFDFGALHHIPENTIAIKEVARVLKPGGRFYFQEPLSALVMSGFVRLFTEHPPEAQFTWEELKAKLAGAGLKVDENNVRAGKIMAMGVAVK